MRQRALKACLACRRRKRKCDGQKPCRNCDDYEYQCVYDYAVQRQHRSYENPAPRMESAAKLTGMSQLSPMSAGVDGSTHRNTHPTTARTRGFLDLHKSRYFNKESCASFPRSLAVELQTSNLPRLHAFAYHAGVRSEPIYSPQHSLTDLITLAQVKSLVDIYESTIHPVFGILDLTMFSHQCDMQWNGTTQGEAFEAIAAGVVALASLFSNFLTRQVEAIIVEHAKCLLEGSLCVSPPNIHWVRARILRTIYLRGASQPWPAWLCSSTTMHFVEAVGLHRSPEEVTVVVNSEGRLLDGSIEMRERTFQVARSLNLIISYDYGRSSVNLGTLNPRLLPNRPKDFTDQFCSLVCLIAVDDTALASTTENTDLLALLERVCNAPADHDFIVLTRAELALCIYRRLHHFGYSLAKEKIDQIVAVGMPALQAARQLAALEQPWWNILGTVFHFICVLLSVISFGSACTRQTSDNFQMNTNSSLELIPEAVHTLEHLSQQLGTHMAMEAVKTANDLVSASLNQRRKAIENLENALTRSVASDMSPGDQTFTEDDWNMFLQPFDQNYFSNIRFTDMSQEGLC
jgi:Fungal Zn(2)-Cys(6) binuclear cluster domain/Fungal specific transcription factor domain